MLRLLRILTVATWALAPGLAAAQAADDGCGPVPEAPACIAAELDGEPFATQDEVDDCQQAVRNYRDAMDLHVQCRTEKTQAIVEAANAAIERFNCRAQAGQDCKETQP